ncbi:alpha/beta fold hydrolase [Flavobacterium sp. P21]|uniref:alpha/beta fold hydrolase n=1 Tax=Flavobacterium sp. P21 TaxID=3423948 RepID=UPI003D6765EC
MKNQVSYKTANIDGLTIFYREAGVRKDSTILLLHGFPSSSHMYRDLIADLAESFHVIAPDYPGFGQSSAPTLQEYNYTFDNLSVTIEHFIDHLNLKNISLYIQDYGGPIGLRIAARRPEIISSLIIQNANAYLEGLGEALAPLTAYIDNQNTETESKARFF